MRLSTGLRKYNRHFLPRTWTRKEGTVRANKAFLLVFFFILVGCTTTTPPVQRNPFDRTLPADCVPLPPTPTYDLRPPTSTPNPTTPHTFPTSLPITFTPYPTPDYIDLSPELPYEDKMVARVYRCNGTWDEYLIDPALFPTAIPLSHGDFIYSTIPPVSLVGHQPPEPVTPTGTQR